ncbi:hypothetical protein DFH09DRAFT_1361645 [Mycena vulgaris]|nr:hypothetical protein DFH09DRAFT_1361645 [Mycena vulgaris]
MIFRHGLPDTPWYASTPGASQCPIPPGATVLYNFTFGGWTGTTLWHHTAMQHTDGLFGPLIVHSLDEARGHNYGAEHVLTLSTGERVVGGLYGVLFNGNNPRARARQRFHQRAERQETHGVEDNPGYPSPSGAPLEEEGYFEVTAKL